MLKSALILFLLLSPVLVMAGPSHYEMSIDVEVREVRAFLSLLNEKLGLRIEDRVLADYAASIAIGNEYSVDVDMHYAGTVFTTMYKIEKQQVDRVKLTFTLAQKRAAKAICQQMSEFSQTGNARNFPERCQYDRLENIEV